MSSSNPHPRLEPLLEEGIWLQDIARALTSQDADRDDLVQDTWLSTLRGRTPSAEHPKGWLGTVARRVASRQRRGRVRRTDHEAMGLDTPGKADGPEVSAERLELAGVLTAELERLHEPFRTTLYLRYYEGLTPAAIAARQNLSASTVRGRLHRGRALLREALIARDGRSWETWSALLLPLAGAPKVGSAVFGGLPLGTLMTMKFAAAGALVGAVAAGGTWIAESTEGPSPIAAIDSEARFVGAPPIALSPSLPSPKETRTQLNAPAVSSSTGEPDPIFGIIGIGVLKDEDGTGIVGGTVRLLAEDGSKLVAKSGMDGGWSLLDINAGDVELEVSAPGYLSVSDAVSILPSATWSHATTLERAPILPVRFEDASGGAIGVDSFVSYPGASLGVAVTRDHPGTTIEARGRLMKYSEAALFETRAQDELPANFGERYQGRLLLSAAPPLWVSLMFGDAVMETRRLDGSETELIFVADDFARFSGTVRVSLIDQDTGDAIVDGVHVVHPSGSRSVLPRLEEGVLVFEGVPPGRLRLEYRNRELTEVNSGQQLRVGPSEILELGEHRIEPREAR